MISPLHDMDSESFARLRRFDERTTRFDPCQSQSDSVGCPLELRYKYEHSSYSSYSSDLWMLLPPFLISYSSISRLRMMISYGDLLHIHLAPPIASAACSVGSSAYLADRLASTWSYWSISFCVFLPPSSPHFSGTLAHISSIDRLGFLQPQRFSNVLIHGPSDTFL